MAARDFKCSLPLRPTPWWEILLGAHKSAEVAEAANALIGIALETEVPGSDSESTDFEIAKSGFLRSLLDGGSFNDPGSFLWEELEHAVST